MAYPMGEAKLGPLRVDFDRQIGSTKRGDRYADCRIRTGFAFDRHICYATGDRKWSSGESRIKRTPGLACGKLPELVPWVQGTLRH